jgi:mannitol 2-dehydrogenase
MRLCFDGSNRQPKFVLPVVRDRLKAGANVKGLALASAMWCRYCYGESESGKAIPSNDTRWDRLQAAARAAKEDPRPFLGMRDIFGALGDDTAYVATFSGAMRKLWSQGVRATLGDYLADKLKSGARP